MTWTQILMNWYGENKRDFPWRQSRNPYRVWLSEIILQQTRVQQGLPYFNSFIQHFPTVYDLANASEESVLKLWQGLGYYSRARNLHATAKWIVQYNDGIFPTTFKELLTLKGVGDYTASAIASICYEEEQAVVDGNVYRFLSRYFGIETPIDHSSAHAIFKKIANDLMKGTLPGDFNQALMEFGSLQCTPKQTDCNSCPFSKECVAFQQGKVADFPIKKRATKVRERHFNYLVFEDTKHKTILLKREQNGIWKNLYEFPLIETPKKISKKALISHPDYLKYYPKTSRKISAINSSPIKHLLSHQRLWISFWKVNLECELEEALDFTQVKALPVPVVIQDFIEKELH